MADHAGAAFDKFVGIIKALRTPGTGCPWDLAQTHQTLRPYLLEETYEVLDTLDRGDDPHLREELGDLLLQIVLHAQLAADRQAFSIVEVIEGIAEKMIRRHPHVFGDVRVSGAEEVVKNWDEIKSAERSGKKDRLPPGLPALLEAQRLIEKAAKEGDATASTTEVFQTVREALDRLEKNAAGRREAIFGAMLFELCRLASQLEINAEDSLRAASGRFRERTDGITGAPEPRQR